MDNFKSVAAQLDRRRTFVDRASEIAGGVYRFSSYVTVNNPGEAVAPLDFPILFTEKPVFFWGAEVDPGSLVTDGAYPMVVPIVRNWHFRVNEDTGTRWYLGATVLIVSNGVDSQTLVIGCHFEGKGLRQPVTA